MRIISQDGYIDIPYENTILKVCETPSSVHIVGHFPSGEVITLAKYKEICTALKNLKNVRLEYEIGKKRMRFLKDGE